MRRHLWNQNPQFVDVVSNFCGEKGRQSKNTRFMNRWLNHWSRNGKPSYICNYEGDKYPCKGYDQFFRKLDLKKRIYIDNGADGIMIHSKDKDIKEVITFCIMYKKFDKKVPLVVVPTTYNQITEQELIEAGVDVVIYANHLLRSSYPAMVSTAKTILKNKRAYEF